MMFAFVMPSQFLGRGGGIVIRDKIGWLCAMPKSLRLAITWDAWKRGGGRWIEAQRAKESVKLSFVRCVHTNTYINSKNS